MIETTASGERVQDVETQERGEMLGVCAINNPTLDILTSPLYGTFLARQVYSK